MNESKMIYNTLKLKLSFLCERRFRLDFPLGISKKYILNFGLFLMTSAASAAPVISNVSGTLLDGKELTISGSGFGNVGPKIVLFDDFSGGGAHNSQLPTGAVVGTWQSMEGLVWADPLLSKGKGARVVHAGNANGWVANWIGFGGAYSEVYMSSRAYVPKGYRFPRATALKTMPTISALKHHWMFYGPQGYGVEGHDIFGPNWTGSNWHRITSNKPKTYVFQEWGSPEWEWDRPIRWSHWVKGNGTNSVGTEGYFQGISSTGQTVAHYNEANMAGKVWFDSAQNRPYAFDRGTIPGYLRGGNYPVDNYVIDDVYVAVGPGAAARVEIGNCPNYYECTAMAISTPTQWSTGQIRFTFREGSFRAKTAVYVFVVNAENKPSKGFGPLQLGNLEPIPLGSPNNLHVK